VILYIIIIEGIELILIFKVIDALQLDCLKDTKVLAGDEGLNNEIRFVNVMEVPDVANWIHEYELLLTTAYPFKNINKLEEFMISLWEKNVSALAIKTNRYIDKIPSEILRLADELNIPILELPLDAKFDLIIRDILKAIDNIEYRAIKRSEEIYKKFTDIILSGGDISDIAKMISELTFTNVKILDENEELIGEHLYDLNIKKDKFNNNFKSQKIPVYVEDEVGAYIVVESYKRDFKEEDIIAMERGTEAVAVILVKKRASDEIERKYKNNFLNDIIRGEIKTKEEIIEKGKVFNIDLSNEYLFFLLDIESFDQKTFHKSISKSFEFVFDTYFSKAQNSIVWSNNDNIFIFYPMPKKVQRDKDSIRKMAKDLGNDIKEKIDNNIKEFSFTVGIGTFYSDIMEQKKSYHEAKEAIRLGKLIWGSGRVYHYDELETYNILMQCSNEKKLKEFINRKIGPLLNHDKKYNARLVATLKSILENDCNIKETSEKMFLHRKTVAYRRDQIEEVLNISLNDMEEKFSIYMALKIKDIYNF